MAIKRMLAFLNEEAEKVGSNTSGVLHELLTGYHLLGGKHMSKHHDVDGLSPEQAHDKLKASISPAQYDEINNKAKAAAEHIKKTLNHHGDVHDVAWTSKAGDIKRTTGIDSSQEEDPSDIVATTINGGKVKHHGISLKTTEKKSGNVPVSNLGMEKTHGGGEILNQHREGLKTAFPILKTLQNKELRKQWMKQNPEIESEIKKRNSQVLNNVAQNMSDRLSQLPKEEYVNHIRSVIAAKPTPMQTLGHVHMRHTAYGTGGNYSFHHTDPATEHENILNDPENITHERRGTSVVFSHKGKPFARHRIKFESQSDPLASVKGSGELI
jgi:hypothetical protein